MEISLDNRYTFDKGNIDLLTSDRILCLNEIIKSDNIDSVYVMCGMLITVIIDEDFDLENKVYQYYGDYLRNNEYKDLTFITIIKEEITEDDNKYATVILSVNK